MGAKKNAVQWEKLTHNEILQGDGFYVSFNPAPFGGVGLFGSDNGSSETALSGDDGWMILNGDFRAEYAKAFPKGYEACKRVYEKHKAASRSSWSSFNV